MTEYGVVLFYTTSSAIRAEKLLAKAGYAVRFIPVPRQFSSDCGIALRFDWHQHEQVKSALDEAHVEIDAIHHL
jgi:hypothetical protein